MKSNNTCLVVYYGRWLGKNTTTIGPRHRIDGRCSWSAAADEYKLAHSQQR